MAKRKAKDEAAEGSAADKATLTAILDVKVKSAAHRALAARADAVRGGASVDPAGDAALLCWAAARGEADLVHRLLDGGVPADAAMELNLPPYDYDDRKRWRIANRFCREGEPRRLALTPLAAAVYLGHVEAARLLLDAGADVHGDVDGPMLLHAVRMGHADVADLLLARGADRAMRSEHGHSLLHVAAGNAHAAIVERLLAAGCDPNEADDAGDVPIAAAVRAEDPRCVRALVATGADVNPPPKTIESIRHPTTRMLAGFDTERQWPRPVTPLVDAAEFGHADVVAALLEAGADVAARNEYGRTAYDVARAKNHAAIIALLRDAGAGKGKRAQAVDLFLAADTGDVAAIAAALDGGVDVNGIAGGTALASLFANATPGSAPQIMGQLMSAMRGEADGGLSVAMESDAETGRAVPIEFHDKTALMIAADRGHADAVRLLLDRGADVAMRSTSNTFNAGHSAIHFAAARGDVAVLRLLLDAGADPNDSPKDFHGEVSTTPLHRAAYRGHVEAVRLLLDRGADPSRAAFGQTALAEAASGGHPAVVALLRERGASVAAPAAGERTALHNAAANGEVETVRLLLAQGVDANAMCDDGTPIHAAASGDATRIIDGKKDHPMAVIRALIDAGGDVNLARPDGETPLFPAARFDDAVKFLLDHGADADARKDDGTNPLWWAVAMNKPKSVELLLAAGADPNVVERDDGQSCLDVAIAGKHRKVRAMLEAAGAKRASEINREGT